MMLAAGDKAWQVTLQRASAQRDALGSAAPAAWADLATVWAHRLPVSDGERQRAGQVGASLTDRWRLDWQPELADLGARDQLVEVETGQVFALVAVKVLGRREIIELTTQAAGD